MCLSNQHIFFLLSDSFCMRHHTSRWQQVTKSLLKSLWVESLRHLLKWFIQIHSFFQNLKWIIELLTQLICSWTNTFIMQTLDLANCQASIVWPQIQYKYENMCTDCTIARHEKLEVWTWDCIRLRENVFVFSKTQILVFPDSLWWRLKIQPRFDVCVQKTNIQARIFWFYTNTPILAVFPVSGAFHPGLNQQAQTDINRANELPCDDAWNIRHLRM